MPNSWPWRFTFTFLLNFAVLLLTFSSMIHFEFLYILWGNGPTLSFLYPTLPLTYRYWVVQVSFVEKTVLSPIELSCQSCQNQLIINVTICFWTSYTRVTSLHYSIFVESFEIEMWESSNFVCVWGVSEIILPVWGPLHFHLNFRICLSISAKEGARILVEIL